jgi:malonyl-CoA O-methyltransferase
MLKSSHSDIPRVCADMDKLPLQGASIDVLYSNFAVQWSDDFAALLSSLYKVIKPGGQAYISCVTQGSLNEIKTAFSALDAHNHINSFNSEEYINHSVEKAGFRINRADKKVYIDEYDTPLAAIKSIKAIGATAKNNPDMRRGLLTKQALQRVCNAYPLKRNKAQVSYHVVLLALTKSV